MIRVLIADDSFVARQLLRSVLETEADIEIVGEAVDGRQAVALTHRYRPGLIIMDLEMPRMNGLEAIAEIMSTKAAPILVVSSTANAHNACEALRLGALDVMAKPTPAELPDFIAKVRLLADIVVVTRRRQGTATGHSFQNMPPNECDFEKGIMPGSAGGRILSRRVFAIACSVGGPQALARILPRLPSDFPGVILVAQHVTDGFAPGLAEWLNGQCSLAVRLAVAHEFIQPGIVYISPSEQSLTFGAGGRVVLRDRQPGDIYHPSCDALLESVAKNCRQAAVGIILTGMGSDGMVGMAAIRAAGGVTLAQDAATSVIYGMNGAAVAAGIVDQVLALEFFADTMKQMACAETACL